MSAFAVDYQPGRLLSNYYIQPLRLREIIIFDGELCLVDSPYHIGSSDFTNL